jgi:hypothetical protein
LSFRSRKEHRLRAYGKRELRGIFGPKGDEVTGGWRKLHNVKLHNLYCSQNVIRKIKTKKMRWAGLVACKRRNAHIISVGKPERKKAVGRSRRRR